MTNGLLNKLPFVGSGGEKDDRVPLDDASEEEIQQAFDYLNQTGRKATQKAIEETIYTQRQAESQFRVGEWGGAESQGTIDRMAVAPNSVTEESELHIRDGTYYQIYSVIGFPETITPGCLQQLTWNHDSVRLSVHIRPRDPSQVMKQLRNVYSQVQGEIARKREKGQSNTTRLEDRAEKIHQMKRELIQGRTKLCDTSLYLEIYGETLDELQEVRGRVFAEADKLGLDLYPLVNRQIDGQQALLPLNDDPVRVSNTLQIEAVAALLNAFGPSINQEGGILLGLDRYNRPVIANRFAHSGHSKAVTGKLGSGKTYSVKSALYRRVLNDPDMRTIIFDPLGDDFVDFTEEMGGEVISFGGDSRINPLQIEPPTDAKQAVVDDDLYKAKVRSVLEMLKIHFSSGRRQGMTADEEGVIAQAIHAAYGKKGITEDPTSFDNESPILDDVIEALEIISNGGFANEALDHESVATDGVGDYSQHFPARTESVLTDPDDHIQQLAQNIIPKFESFRERSVNENLNGHTNIDLDEQVICFDMRSFADTGEMPLIMHVMLDWAYQEARKSPKRMDVTFEEAHYLLGRESSRNLLNLFIRHSRHFNTGLTLITQTAEEFIHDEQSREIYDNCDIKQLFYQEKLSDEVKEHLGLSESERKFVQKAARGETSDYSQCMLSSSEFGRRTLSVYTDEFEHHVLDDDLSAREYLQQRGYVG